MFGMFIVVYFAIIAHVGAVYNCPATCLPPACVCGSTKIPGGLALNDTPMFVTLTWDDAIQPEMFEDYKNISTTTLNKNGCPIPSTFFVSVNYTDFHAVQNIANLFGGEIAAHTINHPYLNTLPAAGVLAEINGSRIILSAYAGIPKSQITGFRHPFLAFSKTTLDVVFSTDTVYESSFTLDPSVEPFWPHTLDYGYISYIYDFTSRTPYDPQDCPVPPCPLGETLIYPGKWEIPMYLLKNTTNAVWVTMDIDMPLVSTAAQALANLKYSFTLHYAMKLPFGIYQHMYFFKSFGPVVELAKVKIMTDFIAWASTTYPDVWFVTNQQLIKWIQSPVPNSQMLGSFPCVPAAVDPSNIEICDGINNTVTGGGETALINTCEYPQDSFNTCFTCPLTLPNLGPILPVGGNRTFVIDAGCQTLQTWDPIKAVCVTLKRPAMNATLLLTSNNSIGASPSNVSTIKPASSTASKLRTTMLLFAVVCTIILI